MSRRRRAYTRVSNGPTTSSQRQIPFRRRRFLACWGAALLVLFTGAASAGAQQLNLGHIGSDNAVSEADAGTMFALFRVTITPTAAVDVSFDFATMDGTATAGADYVASMGTATILAGQTNTVLPIGVLDDAIFEGDETFTLTISNPTGGATIGSGSDTGIVVDDEAAPTLSIGHIGTDNTVSEADAGSMFALFRVALSAPVGFDTTFDFATSNGTATAGMDYSASMGTATILAGGTNTVLPIGILDDALSEATEDFTITISNPSGGVVIGSGSDTGFVTDDDPLPGISIGDITVVEGDAGTTNAAFTVSLSAPSGQTVSVQAATANNTATAGSDYFQIAAFTVMFPPGVTTRPFNVVINGDTTVEPDETFFVNLSGASGAMINDPQAVGTIQNDDAPSSLTINNVSVLEGNAGTTNAIFTISLTPALGLPVVVNYSTANNSATAGSDYQNTSGSVTFNPGQTTRTVSVPVIGDTLFETNETFFVNISAISPDAVITDSQGLGTIQNDDPQPSVTIDDVSVIEGNGGTTNAVFTLTLSNPSIQAIAFGYATADNTATAGSDYQADSGTVTFTAGQVTRTVTVLVNGDTVFEPGETFFVNLSGAINASIADGQGLGTIQNDDPQPAVSINDVSVVEGNAGSVNAIFGLTLSNPSSQTVTVNYATADVSATAGLDYTPEAGTVTFSPGQTAVAESIAVLGDLITEGDETFFINLAAPVNASIADNQGVGTIQDDEALPTISVNDVSVVEGNAGTVGAAFNVTLSNPSAQTVTVSYATADGSATTAGNDYQALAGLLTFTPGEVAQVVNVLVNGDTTFEGNETFLFDLSAPSNAALADNQGVGTIQNDDAQPTIDIGDVTLAEGNAGSANAIFNVTLSNASAQTITVDFTTADGTATTADNDYQASAGTLTFNPGQTAQTATVPVNGDLVFESDETFDVNLSGATNATINDSQGVGTIQNDDGQPTIAISDASVVEGNAGTASLSFTISLSNPSAQTVSADFTTADGTATLADNDFQPLGGTASFTPGQTVGTIIVTVNGDVVFETDETVLVNLSNPSNATIADNQGVGTIQNDDGQPTIAIDDVSLAEGDAGQANATFTVTLSNASASTVTVDFLANDGTATGGGNDFEATAGTLTWNPGQTVQTVSVAINGDLVFEGDETFTVDLSNPANATISDGQGVGTIQNDDGQPTISIADANLAEGNAGTASMSFTVTLSNASAQTVTVDFNTADGSATLADNDYLALAGTLTFTPGQTTMNIAVAINGDPTFEGDETFTVDLGNPGNASIADGQGVGTILNDDGVPSMAIDDVTLPEGDAGQTTATFTVSLTVASSQTVSVDFTTTDGTATVADNDYGATAGSLSFAPGQTTMTIAVPVSGDDRFELDETFTVDLSNVVNATLGVAQGTATVQNDDPLPAASIDDINVVEGNGGQTAATFTVSLSNPSAQPVDLSFATADGTATVAGNDYQAAAGAINFAADETSRTIDVMVNGDTTFEGDETFVVDLSGAMGATLADAQGTATVLNDDGVPSIVIGDVSVAEGDGGQTTATLAVTLTIPSSQPVTVDWATTDGSATAADGDYQNASGSLFFAPGETAIDLDVQVLGDLRFEPDESFFVDLSNAAGGSLGDPQGAVTITNDDALPSLTIDDLVVVEGNAGTQTATFTVTLSNPSADTVTVGFATSDGTATVADGDYPSATGTLTFTAGTLTQPIDVQVNGDTTFEGDEVFFVDLLAPTNATLGDGQGQLTIVNDDAADSPSFVIDDVRVSEGDSGTVDAIFTVTLASPDTASYSVDFATTDGTASAAAGDYAAASGTLTLSASGGIGTQTVRIAVNGDTVAEGDETFSVVLSNPSAGAVLVDDRGEATIEDDDDAATLAVSVGDVTLAEGNSGTVDAIFTVSLSAPAPGPVGVDFATADGTATVADGDYQAKSGRMTFSAGQQSRTITVEVNGDTRVEGDETFALLLSNPSGAGLGDARGEATLLDDDGGGAPLLTIQDARLSEGDAGDQDLFFTVTLSPPSTTPVSVDYSTADGTASTADSDYRPATGQLTFAPGQTQLDIAVVLLGDRRPEPDETFFVNLTNPAGAAIADGSAIGTIVDDDDGPGGGEVTLSIGNARVAEGDAGTTAATFTVSLAAPSAQPVSVSYASRDGSARAADGDYQPVSGQLTFSPGQQRTTLTVQVVGDLAVERDETFFVDLSNPVGATFADPEGRGIIDNDDQPLGQVRLVDAGPLSEGGDAAAVEVERFGATGRPVTVTVVVSAGTATAGEDFTALSEVVSWAANERGRREVKIPLVDDNRREEDETLLVQLTNPVNATLEEPSELELVIVDDDKPTGLEVVGDREVTSQVERSVELQARVVGEDGQPIAGAAVAWSLKGEAELEGEETTLSDDEGIVSQRLTLGQLPGRVEVSATLVDGDAEVVFEIVAEGDLGTAEQGSEMMTVADVLDRSCVDAEGDLRAACEYVYTLPAGAQQQVLAELDPVAEAQAQSDLTLQAPQVQLRNITARLSALRGGAVSQVVEQLAFNVQGDPVSLGMMRAAVADYGQDHNRYAAALQQALDRARGLDDADLRGGAASGDEQYVTEGAPRWGVFLNGSASFGERPQLGAELGFDFETQGITAGADVRLSESFVLGLAAGFLDTDVDVARDGGGVEARGYALSLYGTFYRERYYVDGIATYGWSDLDLVRNLDLPQPFMGRSRYVARAEPGSEQVSFGLGGGYDFNFEATRLTVFARASYVDAEIDAYTERGAGPFNLRLGTQSLTSLLSEAGVEVAYPWSLRWGVVQPTLRASYLHEFDDDSRLVRGSFVSDLSGNEFVVETGTPDRDFFNLGLGLTFVLPRNLTFFVLYDTDLERDDLEVYTLSGGIRYQF